MAKLLCVTLEVGWQCLPNRFMIKKRHNSDGKLSRVASQHGSKIEFSSFFFFFFFSQPRPMTLEATKIISTLNSRILSGVVH